MKLKILLAYMIVCIIWGSTYLAIKIGVESFSPFWFAGIRFTIAGIIMLVYLTIRKISFPTGFKNYVPPFLIGSMLLVIGNGGVVWSEQYITSGLAALLAGTVPIWMALIALSIFPSSKISFRIILGILLGFMGMTILVAPEIGPLNLGSLKGVIGMLIAAISWSCGSIYTSRVGRKYNAFVLATLEMLFGGLVLIIIAGITQPFHPSEVSAKAWWLLGYLIVVASCITLSAYTYMMGRASTAWASTYAYVNPVIAVFLGWLILHEAITWNIWTGAIIILLGIGIVNWEQFISRRNS